MRPITREDKSLSLSPSAYNLARPTVPCEALASPIRASLPSLRSDWDVIATQWLGRRRRFVAGQAFFNYDAFGSLRPDREWIDLFSRQHIGLAVHVVLCGFVFYFLTYGYGRLLAEYLKSSDERQVKASAFMLRWPAALLIVLGLLSDAYPIAGYRRKSYMVLGWAISLAMYVVVITMDIYGNSGDMLYQSATKDAVDSMIDPASGKQLSRYPAAYLVVSLVASLGSQMAWLAAVALSVEYAQREQLHHRGDLQATLVVLYYVGGVAAQTLTASIIGEGVNSDHLVSSISLGDAAWILAGVSLVGIPVVLMGIQEEPYIEIDSSVPTMGDRLKKFWRFCHQNVVYRVLFFTVFQLLFVGLFNQNVRDAVQKWSGVTNKKSLTVEAVRTAFDLLGNLTWKLYLKNTSWRKIAFRGSVLYISVWTTLTLCTTFNVVRNEWFYGVTLAITQIPHAWLLIYTFVLATEISDVGNEATTFSLAMSYQTLAGLVVYTTAAVFPNVIGFKVTMAEVALDSATTRANVLKAFVSIAAMNLLCFVLIPLLPQQKLDAQQLRAFGGYNRCASMALLATFVVLLCFNLGVNLVVVL